MKPATVFLITFFLLQMLLTSAQAANDVRSNKTFERIMASGSMRCGYFVWPPIMIKDPKTNELGGLVFDVALAMTQALDLKLIMQTEFNLSTYLQDLNNGLFDIECSGGWPNAKRGKYVEYSKPYGYFAIVAITRADDKRIDNGLAWIDNPEVKVAVIDGETSTLIRSRRFPKAQAVELPSSNNSSDLLLNVLTGKADVTFTDIPSYVVFDKNNPGKLKALIKQPVRLIPLVFSIPAGEYRMQNMVNTALDELLLDGVIDGILKKYDPKGEMFRAAAASQ